MADKHRASEQASKQVNHAILRQNKRQLRELGKKKINLMIVVWLLNSIIKEEAEAEETEKSKSKSRQKKKKRAIYQNSSSATTTFN